PTVSGAAPGRQPLFSPPDPMQSALATILPARAGLVASAPESMMPMVTPSPFETCHASGARSWVSAQLEVTAPTPVGTPSTQTRSAAIEASAPASAPARRAGAGTPIPRRNLTPALYTAVSAG